MRKYITISIVGIIVLYLMFAFIKCDFNPKLWNEALRFIFVLILCVWFIITPMIVALLNDK
jgi:uncharacterized protein (DUF983 family)